MRIEKRENKKFHIVVDNSPEHYDVKKLIPTAVGTDTYITIDFAGFQTDEECTAKIQSLIDQYLTPGQLLLCPLVILSLDTLTNSVLRAACQVIRNYTSSLPGIKPNIVIIINHSGTSRDLCENLHLYKSGRNIYPARELQPPCITEDAIKEIRDGIPVECALTPEAFEKIKDRPICKNGNRFLCLNMLTSENIAFIADRKQFCAPYDPEEIWTNMEADCMSVKITDLIF